MLSSRHPGLHREACAALRAARAAWRGAGPSPVEGVTVLEQPLAGVLQGLLQAGSITAADCEGVM